MTVALNLGSFTDIGSYNDLIARVAMWLDRDDLTPFMQTFVGMIEPFLNRTLRTPEMEVTAYPSFVSGTSTFPLPMDCLAVRGVNMNGRALDAYGPAQMATTFGLPSGFAQGLPAAYSVSGRTVTVAPAGVGDATITLTYWQRIPALTSAAPTNWLLTEHPDVYLYGTLAQAEAYVENPARAAQWTALFEGAVAQIMAAAGKARYGGPVRARAWNQVHGVRA